MKRVIAITKGDGIGPEVVDEGIRILNIISKYTDFEFELKDAPAGGAIWKQFGTNLPDKSFEIIKNADAVLFGAVGLPDLPPGTAESAILKLRQDLDLYVNLRPIKLFESLKNRCPLKDEFIGSGIDITFVRENTEGLYANIGGFLENSFTDQQEVYIISLAGGFKLSLQEWSIQWDGKIDLTEYVKNSKKKSEKKQYKFFTTKCYKNFIQTKHI